MATFSYIFLALIDDNDPNYDLNKGQNIVCQ